MVKIRYKCLITVETKLKIIIPQNMIIKSINLIKIKKNRNLHL